AGIKDHLIRQRSAPVQQSAGAAGRSYAGIADDSRRRHPRSNHHARTHVLTKPLVRCLASKITGGNKPVRPKLFLECYVPLLHVAWLAALVFKNVGAVLRKYKARWWIEGRWEWIAT